LSGQTGSALSGAGGIGGLLARTDGNGTTYYHSDGNGNVTMLVNSAGTMQAQYLYDPYGNTLGMWGPLAVGNTYRFSSKEIEPKSGIYYHGYRYYEPNLQRWLNRDPIAEFGGINLYEFNFNSPPNYVDPDGKHPVIIAAVIAAEAAAAAQLSVDYQKEFGFSNHDKAQAIANNDAAMAKLQEIIDSNGDKTFQQEGLGVGGVLGTQLPGSKCQKFRNLFESLRNIEGYPSAANELGTRIANNGTGAQIPTEDQQTADQRAQLAKAWLARGQAFDRWAKRLF
jgi:RHS repeat-associated protein